MPNGRTRSCRARARSSARRSWRSPMIPRSTIRRSIAALKSKSFYIGALGSKKTQVNAPNAWKQLGFAEAGEPHPRADRPRYRRPGRARDRDRHHGGNDQRAAAWVRTKMTLRRIRQSPRPRGPSSPIPCKLRARCSRKARVLTTADIALFATAVSKRVFAARLDPDDVAEDEAAGSSRAAIAGAGHASCRRRSPAAPTLRSQCRCRRRSTLIARARRSTALHESLTLATAAAFRRGRGAADGGDRQDHSLCRAPRDA